MSMLHCFSLREIAGKTGIKKVKTNQTDEEKGRKQNKNIHFREVPHKTTFIFIFL